MKQIPNFFTLLNLLFGCIAIVFVLQTGQSLVVLNDQAGTYEPVFPERMALGALFIFFAAVVDFLDGFVARLLKASSEMGKQLDSLSDVVSFGIAPGMILYQLLRLGYAQGEGWLDVSFAYLLPAFLFSGAVAWRLAKFNVSTNQSESFKGVPSPAAGLVVASFPLIIHLYTTLDTDNWLYKLQVPPILINPWFIYIVILVLSFLMVSDRTFLAIKFKDYSFANNRVKYGLIFISVVLLVLLRWLAIPVIFILYLAASAVAKTPPPAERATNDKTLDLTV